MSGTILEFNSPGMYAIVPSEGPPVTEVEILTPDLVFIPLSDPMEIKKDIFSHRWKEGKVKTDLLFKQLFTYAEYVSLNPIEDVLGLPEGSLMYHLISAGKKDLNTPLEIIMAASDVYKFNLYLMDKKGSRIDKKSDHHEEMPSIILKEISSREFDFCIPKLVMTSTKGKSEVATHAGLALVLEMDEK